MGRTCRRTAALLLGSAVAAALAVVVFTPVAAASTGQISVIEDDMHLEANPAATLEQMRLLGAEVVRVSVPWQMIAPSPGEARAPRGFDASDPAAYPAANWALWDEIVTDAKHDGITVDLDLMGGAPRWAQGPGRPAGNSNANWEPSGADFGEFVQAIATRYSGSYDPALGETVPGSTDDLPRVGFWSIWNEPNYGPSLAPQGVPGDLTVENSPRMYRGLLDAAWAGLAAAGHGPGMDTILIGELAPRGANTWGVFSGMKPVAFVRDLYCVGASFGELRGRAARIRGCPTTAAGSRRFRAQNPALFEASGFADHPYMRWYPPTVEPDPDPTNGTSTADYASLAVIGHLTRALDRVQRVYGSSTRFPIYDTEFGYITSPPKHSPDPGSHGIVRYLPPATAAYYMNWSEYVSWRNPRIRSFAQYPIYDPVRPLRSNDWGGYASGLLGWNGVPKATYAAWRLPLYLPVTSTRVGRSLEVWGCVRPARFGALDTGTLQAVQIEFASGTSRAFTTIQTVTLGGTSGCYFDVRVKFPASGTVRLGYTYPPSDPLLPAQPGQIVSRSVQVNLHR